MTKTVPELYPLLEQEVQNLLEKGAICEVPFCEDGFYSRLFVIPKRDGSMRPVIDLSSLNHFIDTPHFQMENLATVKSVLRQGHFMTKIDLKDAYFSVAIHPQSQKFLRFLWQNKAFQFCSLPFGLNIAPSLFTRLMKPVAGFLRKRGVRLILYLDDMLIIGSTPREVNDFTQMAVNLLSAGVHNQPGQIGSNPNSGYNISRVYNQFNNHAFHSTLRESTEITDTLPTDSFELEGSPSNPGPTSGSFGILSPSRVASTSSFLLPTSSSHQRSEPNESQLRGSSFVMLPVPRGNQLVATESRNSQWQPDYNTIFRSDNIHRRLFDGLGSCLWEHTNQREVVCHRETVAYKCSRTEGGNAGNTVAPEESKFENNIPEYGQLYSGGLYQPQGGHPLPRASPGGTTTLELVHSAQPIHNSIPCSRENQCGCRSRVERIYRQQRLESRPDNHFSLSEGLLHRPVCVTSDASTCQIHQLEARPPSIQGGRFQCELETPKELRIPSVQPHRAGSRQGDDGQDGSCSSSTNMASATLVAPPARHAGTTTSSASVLIDSSNRPNGSPTHSPDVPSSSSGRISYLQQRYQAEGIPRNTTQLLISATRNSTQKTYEFSWKRWCSWCDRRETDPISASLKSILSFLADCFDEGLQYRSLNVLRSALSSTHPNIDGYPVGQHPYVLNLMKGILNNRPPKPRYSYTWDVRQVTEYIEKMGNNSSLSLKQLSLKLATLQAITCPKRVSSLARLDINHLRLSPEGATFTLTTPTKTSRPDETVTAFFSSFQTNLVLCPVDCLNSYISITKPFRNLPGKEPNILFIWNYIS